MKILKYLFLLVLLAAVAVTVYVFTQKSNFQTRKDITVNIPKSIVYNYLNDYKFWEDWYFNKKDISFEKIDYSEITSGRGAYISWANGGNENRIQTVFTKFNDSIAQKVVSNDETYISSFKLKDTVGGTKIIWTSKGNVSFSAKVNAAVYGGVNKLMDIYFENNLMNFKKSILKEINSFQTKLNGIVQIPGRYYVKQTFKCPESKLDFNLKIMVPKMINFFGKNKMPMNGKPFVIFQKRVNDTVTFSICAPLKEQIFISSGSDLNIGFQETFNAVKVTLTGDYSHRKSAKDLAVKFINQSRIGLNSNVKEMEVYSKSITDTQHPSQWITEILVPVNAAVPVTEPVPVVKKDTLEMEPI